MAGLGSYLDLFLKLKSAGGLKDYKYLCEVIVSQITTEISYEDRVKIQEFCRNFTTNLSKRWAAASRSMKTFLNRNGTWLENDINWPACDTVDLNAVMGNTQELSEEPALTDQSVASVGTSEAGTSTVTQIRKPFEDLSNRQKKRRSYSLVDDHTEEELRYFYTSKLKASGKLELAKIVEHLGKNSEAVVDVTKQLFKQERLTSLSEDKSLALNTSLDLSKWKYQALRLFLQEENCAALPSYQKLLSAKKRCYPTNMECTEKGACIKLQALLDHTVERILLNLGPVTSFSSHGLKMTWKWGLDGSSSQSNYRQRSLDPELNDSSVVMISIVPLRMVDGTELVVWENPTPSSTQYCRPVKFTFTTETSDFVKTETSQMQQEISELVPTHYEDTEIAHELHMTMIDGKVANIVADVPSSATCPICLAKPSEMNNLDQVATKPIREDIYKYGISSLHMRIRCMECLLHISYNMDFERWSARGENKALKQAKKVATQREFREETGILIDIVKQGFGITNDGNTARRFFDDYKRSARITGIDENLIFRFSVLLQALFSGKRVNVDRFRSYCKETAEMYVHLYPWYYMPTSVHKLLMHGADICSHFSVLPIGILSEEASEARNKDFRNVRERHTRKTGRKENNENILHNLLISSDPHISRIRSKITKPTHKELLPEAVELLLVDSVSHDFEEEELMKMESENIPDPLA